MLTYLTLKNDVKHALHGSVPDTLIDLDELINEGCTHVVSMNQWNFLLRPSLLISFVASQDYVNLPHDFGQAEVVIMSNALVTGFQWTDLEDIIIERNTKITTTNFFKGALVYPAQPGPKEPPPPPRIELWPTPASATTDAFTIIYRAKWVDLNDDDDVTFFPTHLRSLVRQVIRAFARGYEEDSQAELDQRLEIIENGSIFSRAVDYDSLQQPDYGLITGGAVEKAVPTGRLPHNAGFGEPT